MRRLYAKLSSEGRENRSRPSTAARARSAPSPSRLAELHGHWTLEQFAFSVGLDTFLLPSTTKNVPCSYLFTSFLLGSLGCGPYSYSGCPGSPVPTVSPDVALRWLSSVSPKHVSVISLTGIPKYF